MQCIEMTIKGGFMRVDIGIEEQLGCGDVGYKDGQAAKVNIGAKDEMVSLFWFLKL